MPVFKNPEDVRDIVRCCPNHTMDNVDKTSKFNKALLLINRECYFDLICIMYNFLALHIIIINTMITVLSGFSSVKHFVRCGNEQVSYKECPLTGRYYLALPFIPSQRGEQFIN